MKLYHCLGARSLRALWTIEELGLDCDLVVLPFPPRKRVAGWMEANPLGTIPLLVDGPLRMTESVAIAQYLATVGADTSLAVAPDETDYGWYLDFLHHADATLTFPQTVYMRYRLFEPHRGLEVAGDLYAQWYVARLAKVAARLADRAYLCADRFTAADIAIAYALFLSTRIGLGDRLPPRLVAWLATMTARPAFQSALAREAATPVVDSMID
ncbi:glutathione S-transferase family protein [Polymorphobacter fuscus]|uniref:glutathione S-transferase family protein n=1 Tax=Sandarakinorhabdus fusca TaxID=1439888 RepID=UPI0016B03D66|nr:glutathione S-transferase family protein [Polymorphobacter fuscus]NJC09513.1 glutathione S-transferase [Polymorphobacter fuscus]